MTSRLDYCNSQLAGIGTTQLDRLQRAQNYSARVILKIPRTVDPDLSGLHWLPIKFRIDFKIAVIVFKCINGLAPVYLSDLISSFQPRRTPRSDNGILLTVPRTTNGLGDRSFKVYGPHVWNTLPKHVRAARDICTFKKLLKTCLFKLAFK